MCTVMQCWGAGLEYIYTHCVCCAGPAHTDQGGGGHQEDVLPWQRLAGCELGQTWTSFSV